MQTKVPSVALVKAMFEGLDAARIAREERARCEWVATGEDGVVIAVQRGDHAVDHEANAELVRLAVREAVTRTQRPATLCHNAVLLGTYVDARLRELTERWGEAVWVWRDDYALEQLDRTIVTDVSCCAEWSGFPVDLRDLVHEVVLRHSVVAQPRGAVMACPNYETTPARIRGMVKLSKELHDVFHVVGSRRLAGFSDDPKEPLIALAAVGEDRRTSMRPPNLRYWIAQIADLAPHERDAAAARVAQRAYDVALRSTGDENKAIAVGAEMLALLGARGFAKT